MTKRQYLDRHFEIFDEGMKLWEQLGELRDRHPGITTHGSYYYLLPIYESYGYKSIAGILEKASKSKSRYFKVINRTDLWNWGYYIKDMEKALQKIKEEIAKYPQE